MGTTKFDVEKFTGDNDFGLWRIKMRALLVQQDLQEALKGEKMSSFSIETDKEKVHKEILQKARSALILSLGDKILRKVTNKDIVASIWLKLENLYMTKSLANRLHKKTHIYTFKMSPGTHIEEHLDEFNKIIFNLANIDIKDKEEDLAILLLTSLDLSYLNIK